MVAVHARRNGEVLVTITTMEELETTECVGHWGDLSAFKFARRRKQTSLSVSVLGAPALGCMPLQPTEEIWYSCFVKQFLRTLNRGK